ncbi:MAG: phosphoribosylanthranilate isomerase [Longimicrobiales bacterium]
MAARPPLVKICGLTRNEDARLAQEAGADYVGMVLSQGFGRSVPEGSGPAMIVGVTARRVAVTVNESAETSAALAHSIDASVIQLHGGESVDTARTLRGLGPWSIWKAVRARSLEDVRRVVQAFGETIDGVLVEGWRDGAIGGAGLTLALDPRELSALVPSSLTFILAGGLRPDSVVGAVAQFAPDVVDVSSGVEREPGSKDPALVEAFIHATWTATVDRQTTLRIKSTRDQHQ